ncbi:hypothetical protein BGZ99_000498 [Dissophora globulifera]|uniref:Uncharacterized protein n=1 Tax=Dissophora globulifera TaxID=979702 RepID=A0A9P6V0N6_9FUNG|nr:hypothetical protein BGZ99_000498 [Dissophora globulifera]
MDGIGQVPQQAYHAASNSSSAEPYAHIDQDLLSADIIDPEPICGSLLSLHAASYLKQSELGKVLDRISMNISQGYYSLFALYVDAILAGERAHAKNFKQLMAGLISTLANAESTTDDSHTLRVMRGARDVRDVREEDEASVDKLLLMHQDVLDSLADLQCRVRVLINTTYELFRFKLLNGIDDINDHSLSKSTLAAMLDDAINYIRNWLALDSSTFATSGRTLRDTSRLRPVMSLMESGKLQNISLGLEFVDNVMGLGGTSIPNLRVLMLELGSFSKSIRVNFSRFLSRLTHLVELLLRCNDIEKVYTLIQERIHSIPALERLKLDTQDKYVDIRLQAGIIELSGRFHAAQRIIDDRDITMIRIPFDTDSFASDVSWLDQRYTDRHRALVVEFFGMNNEAVAGVEFRPLDSAAGTSSYGERFRGNNSAMFIRWGDDDYLLSSECIQDSD